MIRIAELGMVYPGGGGAPVEALRGISLAVGRGELVSIVGPSGCGKSTLLKVIAGLYRPTAGGVWVGGEPVSGTRRDVGLVFQNPILLPWRTVLQNVLLPVEVLHLERAPYEARARDLLRSMGLEDFAHRYPHQLSGGMQQRAAIARALVHDPAMLLMDEPFAALDAMTRETMNLELARLWEATHKTILFVTHSIMEAVFLSSRVVVMSARPGRILETITVDLPQPRTLDLMATPRFGAHAAHIRSLFEAGPGRPGARAAAAPLAPVTTGVTS
ncbi:MAG: ABC transporter ATP-binding protein [Candidatus Rokubacteria bacterium]|nr:ABC transporter ATP-binding protein [Candidatus Rokubacteria bacterium]